MHLFIFTHLAMVYFFSIFLFYKWGKTITVMGQETSRASCITGGASCPMPKARRPLWTIYLTNNYRLLVLIIVTNVLVLHTIITQ